MFSPHIGSQKQLGMAHVKLFRCSALKGSLARCLKKPAPERSEDPYSECQVNRSVNPCPRLRTELSNIQRSMVDKPRGTATQDLSAHSLYYMSAALEPTLTGQTYEVAPIMGALYGPGITGLKGAFSRDFISNLCAEIMDLYQKALQRPGGAVGR